MAKNMNKIFLSGRTVRDPEVRYSQGEKPMAIANVTIAVDKGVKDAKEGQQTADFIPLTAFGKLGEVFEKYVTKGTKINVIGHIQTGSYTNKDGQKVYTWSVVVDELEMLSKAENTSSTPSSDDYLNIPDELDDFPID